MCVWGGGGGLITFQDICTAQLIVQLTVHKHTFIMTAVNQLSPNRVRTLLCVHCVCVCTLCVCACELGVGDLKTSDGAVAMENSVAQKYDFGSKQ